VGRGLSDLQRYILERAAAQEQLYFPEVLHGFFGWKPAHPLRHAGGEYWEGQHFSLVEIGIPVYRRAIAALSRAVRRLEALGLVRRLAGPDAIAVVITAAGRQALPPPPSELKPVPRPRQRNKGEAG
jgi:hypothetical protein